LFKSTFCNCLLLATGMIVMCVCDSSAAVHLFPAHRPQPRWPPRPGDCTHLQNRQEKICRHSQGMDKEICLIMPLWSIGGQKNVWIDELMKKTQGQISDKKFLGIENMQIMQFWFLNDTSLFFSVTCLRLLSFSVT